MPKMTAEQIERLFRLALDSLHFHEERLVPEDLEPSEWARWRLERGRLCLLIPYKTLTVHAGELRALLEEITLGKPN